MQMVFATVVLMAFLMLIMAVGVIFRRPPLKGSCGGIGAGDCFCAKKGVVNACENPAFEGPQGQADGVTLHGG
jgi:hypothetical protein